jgi:type I restriction enzyme S subunit
LKEEGTPIILYGRLYTKYETSIREVDTFVTPKEGSVYSRGGEVIVPASGETAEDISRASTVENAGIILGGDLNVIKPNDDINPAFLALSISNGNLQKELAQKAQGKSIVHIHNEEIKALVVPFPHKEEQDKIVVQFSQLDRLITLHQRKCDETKMLKKYMLQKMFPKDGKCVPEIRFSGYTDDWEQCKLGEVLTLLKDGTHGTHKDSDYGPYLLSAKNIKNGQIIIDESSDRKISEAAHEQIHSSFKLQRGDVLLTIVGSIGESAILENTEGLTFQRSVAFLRPNNEMTSRFLRTEIEADKFQKELQDRKSQSAQPGVYLGELEKIPVVFPKIDEQKKIGAYFSSLDHLITLHQRKCDELKKMKKFMLQNMFV